jgi:tetratricopeptide (TPR) repeat protein
MPFQPQVNQEFVLDGVTYRMAEHPAAPGMPYGQEGRQATVYQLVSNQERRALKVFKARFRAPALVSLSDRLRPYVSLPGLAACRRSVLSPERHASLLKAYPDLLYAVVMPWIDGPTWFQVLLEKRDLQSETCLDLARTFAGILSGMEQNGVAHCDLSGPNVLLPALAGGSGIALVDLEQMYGPDLRQPSLLPGGSPGYALRSAPDGLWSQDADRFAGAVLLAELLGWCDERVRDAAWGESYFDPNEMQKDGDRYNLLVASLRRQWGEPVAELFKAAWHSQTPADCPTFGEWLLALPEKTPNGWVAPLPPPNEQLNLLLARARRLETSGDVALALASYKQALQQTPPNSALRKELEWIIEHLQRAQESREQLKNRLSEAAELEKAAKWTAAAAIYQELLGLESSTAQQREEWNIALRRCSTETDLVGLFASAEQMIGEDRLAAAREILEEIERRHPGYERSGKSAAQLLRSINEREARQKTIPPRRALRGSILGAVSIIVIALLGTLGLGITTGKGPAGSFFWTPTFTPTSTPTPAATSTATPIPTHTPSVTASVTRAPTETATPTASSIPTSTATSTQASTSTPTVKPTDTLTPIPSPTRQPTNTAIPTQRPIPAITLGGPSSDFNFSGPEAKIELAWSQSGRVLGSDEYYVVTIQYPHDNTTWYDYQWTRATQLVTPAYLYDLATGDRFYTWSVMLVRLTQGKAEGDPTGRAEVLARSAQTKRFLWTRSGSPSTRIPSPAAP